MKQYRLVLQDFDTWIYYGEIDDYKVYPIKKGMLLKCTIDDPEIYIDNDGDGVIQFEKEDLILKTKLIIWDDYDYCFKDTFTNILFPDDPFIYNTLDSLDLIIT